ncbi:MAG: hypothetical protein JST00_09030 [Deltaproteobacteria bacterium]|nr:hypothetical protein [Deltaproteobacteria bacterium]
MKRVVLGLVALLACSCARREVVVDPSQVPHLQDQEWRISSVPGQSTSSQAVPAHAPPSRDLPVSASR